MAKLHSMITHILVLIQSISFKAKNTESPERRKTSFPKDRSSRPEVFCDEGVLGGFAGFAGERLCRSLIFYLGRRLTRRCFPAVFAKFLGASFLAEHLRWLLLKKNCRNTDLHKPVLNKIMAT